MTVTLPAGQKPGVRLQKSRMRHTWIGALLALAVILFSRPAMEGLEEVLEWVGNTLLIAAVLGRMISSLYVGGRKNYELVQHGPFSIVRNPLYVCSFLGVIGVGLVTGMLTFTIVLVAVFMLYYPHVVAREEAFLDEKFGEEYRDYCRRVPRWIPRLGLWRSPETIETQPRFVLITLRDTVWFLLFLPMIELLEYLHEIGAVPVFLKLY